MQLFSDHQQHSLTFPDLLNFLTFQVSRTPDFVVQMDVVCMCRMSQKPDDALISFEIFLR